jgi:hypothetical protein
MSTASRIAALRAMADQDVSPHEAEIARAKLLEMGAGDREPPQRPPAAPGGSYEEHFWPSMSVWTSTATGGTVNHSQFGFTIWVTTAGQR